MSVASLDMRSASSAPTRTLQASSSGCGSVDRMVVTDDAGPSGVAYVRLPVGKVSETRSGYIRSVLYLKQ